jgi:hypothetical protein
MKTRLCVAICQLRIPIQDDGRSHRNSTSAFPHIGGQGSAKPDWSESDYRLCEISEIV